MNTLDMSESEEFKNKANKSVQQKHYNQAIQLLHSSYYIFDPTQPVYYSNTDFFLAYIKTECYGYALQNANTCLSIDPKYIKGYYRRAMSYMALSQFKNALKNLKMVCQAQSNDQCREKIM